MTGPASIGILLAALILGGQPAHGGTRTAPREKPFFDARENQAEYHGPGREIPEPEDLTEVRIGYFGPGGGERGSDDDSLYLAASLAIEEANADGGYRGLPFRLVPGWSGNPWGTGVAGVARMVYDEGVWAIIGSVDGASTHLVEQVVAKARLPLVSPSSTDSSVHMANVAWTFSCVPGDRFQVPVLGGAIVERDDGRPFLLISGLDHDSRRWVGELEKYLAGARVAPQRHIEFSNGRTDDADLAREAARSGARAVVVLATPTDSARIVTALRAGGYDGALFGGPSMARRSFLQSAGPAAAGAIVPFLFDLDAPQAEPFVRTFTERHGAAPDFADAHAYDSARLIVDAVRAGGLNRAAIRDALRRLSPWPGVGGPISWDPLGENSRAVGLAMVRDGRLVPRGPGDGRAAPGS
jgi:branched-chain amino acid transport system substrate-binding protein